MKTTITENISLKIKLYLKYPKIALQIPKKLKLKKWMMNENIYRWFEWIWDKKILEKMVINGSILGSGNFF